MTVFTELPTAFPWYRNILNQFRYRDKPAEYRFISPRNALLPFEFWRAGAAVATWTIHTPDGANVATINTLTLIRSQTREGRKYFYYGGEALGTTAGNLNLAPGFYYSRISFLPGTDIFYSEMFCVPACSFEVGQTAEMEFLKLEWWNSSDMRPIFYNDLKEDGTPYFKNVVYLDSIIHASEPEIITEGKKDGTDEVVPTFRKAILRYRITELVPDYLKVALVLMQMHDNIIITLPKGLRSGPLKKVVTASATEPGGALSTIDLLIQEDLIIIQKGCGDNMS